MTLKTRLVIVAALLTLVAAVIIAKNFSNFSNTSNKTNSTDNTDYINNKIADGQTNTNASKSYNAPAHSGTDTPAVPAETEAKPAATSGKVVNAAQTPPASPPPAIATTETATQTPATPATTPAPATPATPASPAPATPATPAAKEAVIPKAKPKLLDLGSVQCIPCKMMEPILEELRTQYGHNLTVEFIDVRVSPAAARKYGIRAIPTQIFLAADGSELGRHQGFMSKADILAKWQQLGVKLGEPITKSESGTTSPQ